MADFVGSTALRDLIANSVASFYYFITLHDATGGFIAGDVYAAGVRGELPTKDGYTQGGKPVVLSHIGGAGGVLDGSDVVWTSADPGTIGPASFAALWVNTTDTITGAKLVSVDDSSATPQTASNGGQMFFGVTDPITIPTPS